MYEQLFVVIEQQQVIQCSEPWEKGEKWDEPCNSTSFLPRILFIWWCGMAKQSVAVLPNWNIRNSEGGSWDWNSRVVGGRILLTKERERASENWVGVGLPLRLLLNKSSWRHKGKFQRSFIMKWLGSCKPNNSQCSHRPGNHLTSFQLEKCVLNDS